MSEGVGMSFVSAAVAVGAEVRGASVVSNGSSVVVGGSSGRPHALSSASGAGSTGAVGVVPAGYQEMSRRRSVEGCACSKEDAGRGVDGPSNVNEGDEYVFMSSPRIVRKNGVSESIGGAVLDAKRGREERTGRVRPDARADGPLALSPPRLTTRCASFHGHPW